MEFFLKRDGIRKVMLKHIGIQLSIVAPVLIFLYFPLKSMTTLYFAIAFTVVLYTTLKQTFVLGRMKKEWNTYKISVDADGLTKTQYKSKEVTLLREDIQSVSEIPGRGIFIRTDSRHDFLYIPAALDRYEVFKSELAEWVPIEESPISQPLSNTLQLKLTDQKQNSLGKQLLKIVAPIGILYVVAMLILLLLSN